MDYTKDGVLIEDIILKHHHQDEELSSNVSFPGFDYGDLNDTSEFVPYSMRPETYIVPSLFAIIFIIGILGNGTLIGIFLKHTSMRNVPNMYIVSLAVGDLFVILFCVPFTSTLYTLESWPWGEFMCKFSEFIKDLSIGVSVFTLTALSADRYFAIVDPMRKLHGRRATKITCLTIAGIWVLSVVLALPSALFSYVRVIDEVPTKIFLVCYPYPPELGDKYPQVMVMFHFLVYYAIPLFFIATFYIIMARHLILSTRNMPGEAQGQAKQIQARKKVAKMILSFVVIFALCFFPSHLFLLWFYFNPNSLDDFNDFWHACRITGFCLSFINSCINPITLYCVSGTFRKQFNEHLFCCCCEPDGRSRPIRRRGFGCGCVSLSSTAPYVGDHRLRNGGGGTYIPGRSLYRGSITNNSVNGCNNYSTKRKSTYDSQSTVVSHNHNYNLVVTPNPPTYSTNFVDTPILTPEGRSSRGINTPVAIAMYPPYQKDYQDYLNRINALEKGDLPPPLKMTEIKIKTRRENGPSPLEDQVTMTSFINMDQAKKDKGLSSSESSDTNEHEVISPLLEQRVKESSSSGSSDLIVEAGGITAV